MEDMWRHRAKPTPLVYKDMRQVGSQNGSTSKIASEANGIKDQRELSLNDSFELFLDSLSRLTARVTIDPDTPLDWDKDDDDALDFATAAANLRAHSFGIASKTRFDVKRERILLQWSLKSLHLFFKPFPEMAGNIIPAIATTNAIVAGLIVLQALNVLRQNWESAKLVWVGRSPEHAISSTIPSKPNPICAVCTTPYVHIEVDTSKLTLSTFITEVVQAKLGYSGDVGLVEGSRLLFDPDFEDNADKTFAELSLAPGTMVTVNDEEGDLSSTVCLIAAW